MQKNFQLKMMKHNNLTIESRILKLAKEEEKARKRINDAERQKKFLTQLSEQKKEKFKMTNDHFKTSKDFENSKRALFNSLRKDIR